MQEGFINLIPHTSYLIPRAIKRKGFSLAEIVIILGIVGIVASGILPLFLNTITASKSASYYSTAYKIADSKIEEYRNTDFNTLANETVDISSEIPAGQIVTTVTAEDNDLKKIDTTVSWNFKRDQDIRIVTYVYRNGL